MARESGQQVAQHRGRTAIGSAPEDPSCNRGWKNPQGLQGLPGFVWLSWARRGAETVSGISGAMMFDHQHYVPVLRMKPAELRALRDLEPTLRTVITPILECPPRVLRGCNTRQRLDRQTERMVGHLTGWRGRSLFIDFDLLPPWLAEQAPEAFAATVARAGIRPVFVVSLKTGAESACARAIRNVLNRQGASICLRVSPEE